MPASSPPPSAVDGIVLLDKPEGLTSNAALQRVRRAFQERKAGHTGSLDPLASGLLPICLGQATKVCGFLLDADNAASFDFSANYVVLNFARPPSIARSARLFETVGAIDPELFETDTSGYTQYGRAYLSLQSAVPDDQFIAGYVEAASRFGVEYTPIVGGVPSLFQGGAAFPGNDWTASPGGEDYLSRIPPAAHRALGRLRAFHLRATQKVLRRIEQGRRDVVEFACH